MRFFLSFSMMLLMGSFPAAAQSQDDNCLATTLGQTGCGQGMRPYVSNMGDTLGDRGNNWYTSDHDPDDDVYGARPYTETLGRPTDSYGNPYSGTLGGTCNPLLPGDCN